VKWGENEEFCWVKIHTRAIEAAEDVWVFAKFLASKTNNPQERPMRYRKALQIPDLS
jgi:hypothetical protein